MQLFDDIFDTMARIEADGFVRGFRTQNMRVIMNGLGLYVSGDIPGPIELLGTPPPNSNAAKLLGRIKSAAGLVLIHSAEYIRDQDREIPPELAERYLQDPLFIKLRALAEELTTSNLQ